MIEMGTLIGEIAKRLYRSTGVFAACDSVSTQTYPTFVVSGVEKSVEIMAGGAQAMRTIGIDIKCYSSRAQKKSQGAQMVEKAFVCLMPSVGVCGRHFTPTDVESTFVDDCAQITFNITFCDILGVREAPPVNMGSIKLDIEGGK